MISDFLRIITRYLAQVCISQKSRKYLNSRLLIILIFFNTLFSAFRLWMAVFVIYFVFYVLNDEVGTNKLNEKS